MKRTTILPGIVSLAIVAGAISAWGLDLPVTDSCDTTGNWTGATVAGSGFNGGNCLSIADQATATLTVDGNKANVWVRCVAKVTRQVVDTVPDIAAGTDAAFYIDTDGHVFASNGVDAWEEYSTSIADGWARFAVHLDYGTDKWDLYLESSGTQATANGTLTKLNSAPLAMLTTSGDGFDTFEVKNATLLDDVALAAGIPSAATPSTLKTATIGTKETGKWYQSHVPANGYTEGAATLDGALGADLAAGLNVGDKIRFYDANGWNVYVLDSDGKWGREGNNLDMTAPADQVPAAGTQYFIEYVSVPPADSVGFYSAAFEPSTVASTLVSQNGAAWQILRNTGSEAGGNYGWTQKHWTGGTKTAVAAGMPVGSLPDDTIVVLVPDDSSAPSFSGQLSGGSFYHRGKLVDLVLQNNHGIWVKNPSGDTDYGWTVSE